MVLTGFETKNLYLSRISMSGAYVQVLDNELWLMNCCIENCGPFSDNKKLRKKKLLCHKREIENLKRESEAKGMALVPLKIYVKNGKFKLEIGIARGKNSADKRETLKARVLKREIENF